MSTSSYGAASIRKPWQPNFRSFLPFHLLISRSEFIYFPTHTMHSNITFEFFSMAKMNNFYYQSKNIFRSPTAHFFGFSTILLNFICFACLFIMVFYLFITKYQGFFLFFSHIFTQSLFAFEKRLYPLGFNFWITLAAFLSHTPTFDMNTYKLHKQITHRKEILCELNEQFVCFVGLYTMLFARLERFESVFSNPSHPHKHTYLFGMVSFFSVCKFLFLFCFIFFLFGLVLLMAQFWSYSHTFDICVKALM